MRMRTVLLVLLAVVFSAAAAALITGVFAPGPPQQARPSLTALPPLQPLTGTSTVLAPTAIALSAIRDALDAQAPRNLSGKPQNPLGQLLANAQLSFSVTRGPFVMATRPETLVVTTPLTGTFEALGTVASGASSGVGAIGGAVGNLIGGNVGQQVQHFAGGALNQKVDLQGTVVTTSRPAIAANWRLIPNLSAQVSVADVSLPIAGAKLNVASAVKPALDGMVREQIGALETRLRNDPFIENAARSQWTKLCRAIPLGGAGQAGAPANAAASASGLPNLWLEIKPVRAIAAQPQVDGNALTLLVGVQAQTRIVASETKPACPFPNQLDLVAQGNEGRVTIGVPIDIPFGEVSRLLQGQFAGKTFPEDRSGSFYATIKQASVAAPGDRLLISLLVNVKKSGLFALGADATVYVWGRPVLDQDQQILRFTDVTLDVESRAAFGLLGAAADAAAPYLQKMLVDKAVIDLKPFAADAKKRLAAAVGDFAAQEKGLRATVSVDELRLTGVAYDSKTLRIIANANGSVNVAVSSLTAMQ
jgi:Domain of unknown function (DUF4403)